VSGFIVAASLVRAKPVSAGETVKLPAEEVAQLRASGHLVDPNAVSIPVGDGPTFGAAGGPSVKVDVIHD